MSRVINKPLEAVAEYVTVGYVGPSSEYFCNDGVPFLRTGNVGIRQIIWSNLKQVVPAFHRKQTKSALKTGDVVVSRVISNEVNAAVVPRELDGANCGNVLVVRPGAQLYSEYLVQLIGCPASQRALLGRQVGSAQAVINTSVLKAWEVPVLPLAEQRRIAEVLDRAEALRAKRRAALAQLDTLTQSLFLDLFGDPKIPACTIGALLETGVLLLHKDGNHGSLYPRAEDFGAEGIPFLSAKAISDDGVINNALIENLREEKAVKLRIGWISKGDVLLAHNASVGKVALYDGRFEKALIGTSLTAFRPAPDRLDSHYLAAAFRSSRFQRELEKNMGQTTRNQVPITAQRDLKVGIPPITLQREFARRVTAVEALKTAHRRSLAELDALFASLQHRAFRGEL